MTRVRQIKRRHFLSAERARRLLRVLACLALSAVQVARHLELDTKAARMVLRQLERAGQIEAVRASRLVEDATRCTRLYRTVLSSTVQVTA